MEDIDAATLDDVRAFFRPGTAPATRCSSLAGDFDPAAALAAIERWFGGLPAGAPVPRGRARRCRRSRGAVRDTMTDHVQLRRLYLAFRTEPFGSPGWWTGRGHREPARPTASRARSCTISSSTASWRRTSRAYVYPTEEVGVFLLVATARPGVEVDRLAARIREHLDGLAAPAASPPAPAGSTRSTPSSSAPGGARWRASTRSSRRSTTAPTCSRSTPPSSTLPSAP